MRCLLFVALSITFLDAAAIEGRELGNWRRRRQASARCKTEDDSCPTSSSTCTVGAGCKLSMDLFLINGVCCSDEPCKTKCEPAKNFDSCTACLTTGFAWMSRSEETGSNKYRDYCSEQCPAVVNNSDTEMSCFTTVDKCPPEKCNQESVYCPVPANACEVPTAGCVADGTPQLWTNAPNHDRCCPEECATKCQLPWKFRECLECTEIGYVWINGKCAAACPELGSGETASGECLSTPAQCPPSYSTCRKEKNCAACGTAGCAWIGDADTGKCIPECLDGVDECASPGDICPPNKCSVESSSGCPAPTCDDLQTGCESIDGDLFENGDLCCRTPCQTKCKPAWSFNSCAECSAIGFAWAFKGRRSKCIERCPVITGSGEVTAPGLVAPDPTRRALGEPRRRTTTSSSSSYPFSVSMLDGCVESGLPETCPPVRCYREDTDCALAVCPALDESSTCKYTQGELFVTGEQCCPEPCAKSCQCAEKTGRCPAINVGCTEPSTAVDSVCTLVENVLYDRPDGSCCPEPCQFECTPIIPEPIPSGGVQVLYGGSKENKLAFCLEDTMASVTSAATAGAVIDTGKDGASRRTIAGQCCVKGHEAGKSKECVRYGGRQLGCVSGSSSKREGDGPDFYNVKATTYAGNVAMCAKVGAKMGKELELCSWSCENTGCDYNSHLVISNLPCAEDAPEDSTVPSILPVTPASPTGVIPAAGIKVIRGDKRDITTLFCLKPGMEAVTQLPDGVGGMKESTIAAQCCTKGHASSSSSSSSSSCCRRGSGKGKTGRYDSDCIAGIGGKKLTPMTYAENVIKCDAMGLEMCTTSCDNQGCFYNAHGVYTSLPCDE